MNRREFLKLAATGAISVVVADALPSLPGVLPGATGQTLTVEATTLAFRKGDIITFAGRYAVNPITRKATPHLQKFMVTADVTSDEDEIPLFPYHDEPQQAAQASVAAS